MEEVGNQFMEESKDLSTLDTKVIRSSDVIQDMKIAESKSLDQSINFDEVELYRSLNRFMILFPKTYSSYLNQVLVNKFQICNKRYPV